MRVAVTGTPGTGKTSAVGGMSTDLSVIHLNEVVRDRGLVTGRDESRDTDVVDLEAVRDWLAERDDVVIESHLAHLLSADRVVVLRCQPDVLERRLLQRGESPASAAENAEAEALDVVLAEAVERHGRDRVYEIDTTDLTPASVARELEAVVAGRREPAAGTVDFTGYL